MCAPPLHASCLTRLTFCLFTLAAAASPALSCYAIFPQCYIYMTRVLCAPRALGVIFVICALAGVFIECGSSSDTRRVTHTHTASAFRKRTRTATRRLVFLIYTPTHPTQVTRKINKMCTKLCSAHRTHTAHGSLLHDYSLM